MKRIAMLLALIAILIPGAVIAQDDTPNIVPCDHVVAEKIVKSKDGKYGVVIKNNGGIDQDLVGIRIIEALPTGQLAVKIYYGEFTLPGGKESLATLPGLPLPPKPGYKFEVDLACKGPTNVSTPT